MTFAEIKTDNGIVKYPYYTEDFDTIMIYSPKGTKFPDGFDVVIQHNAIYKEVFNCKIIPKSDVVAIYNEWDRKKQYFGNMKADIYESEDGRAIV